MLFGKEAITLFTFEATLIDGYMHGGDMIAEANVILKALFAWITSNEIVEI